MNLQDQIDLYLASQPAAKRDEMHQLHRLVLDLMPQCRLWFLDGKDENGKTVSNPNIGYGSRIIRYADGSSREFYQIGLSANATGISVYIMGLEDREYLPSTFAKRLGKAAVTGYCIKFRKLSDINLDVLSAAMQDGVQQTSIRP